MRKMLLPLLLIGSIGLLLVFHFGEALWRPVYVKLSGGKTVAEVVEDLKAKGIGIHPALMETLEALVILVLKEEQSLEVWGKRQAGEPVLIYTFPFTAYSGGPGPKLREGDRQIPEGVYRIEYLNPNSQFHLSLKVDYPNAFDREKGRADGREKLGFDIFIHGRDSTVGCVPIGDEAIEKLFLLVSEIGKENVSVIMAPYDMRIQTREVAVEGVPWAAELYDRIKSAIATELPITGNKSL